MPKLYVLYLLLTLTTFSYGQQLVYSDVVYGGVTANGGGAALGAGTITFPVQIPQNSTIKKALLIAARDSLADDIIVILNGFNYTFSDSTIITGYFNSATSGSFKRGKSSMHLIDVTTNIDSSVNNYNLIIPPQTNIIKGNYTLFYLYIVFENPIYPKINCNLFLNTQDVFPITNYNLNDLPPINTTNPIALSLATNHFCDTIQDGSYVKVNNDTIGILGGSDLNSSLKSCVGTWANYAHYNDSLFGLDDDTPDSLMAATDALADIKSYVNNGDTAIDLTFIYQSNAFPLTNPIRAVMLSYSTPCDTFTTTITANDTICFGDSIQLNATGGLQYSWFGAFGGLSDTSIANPKASPQQTTTYIVTITNDSGCVKTEQVKIWVNPLPVADTLIVTNNVCGDSVGSVQVGSIQNNAAPYSYNLTNLQTLNTINQTLNTFAGLGTGTYELQITDSNGCMWLDTVAINEVNNVVANFTANPQNGIAPLDVDFTNTSANANNFEWTITNSNGDTLYWIPTCVGNASNCGFSYTFDSSGTYQVCLVAYNNIPTCADTICKTIVIEDEISFIIPNVFTPNGDNDNDNFVIQLTGAALIKSFKAEVYNRWGQTVKSVKFKVESFNQQLTLWDGRTTAAAIAPEGTYFYVISYETLKGEIKSEKGSLSLLR